MAKPVNITNMDSFKWADDEVFEIQSEYDRTRVFPWGLLLEHPSDDLNDAMPIN